MDIKDLTRANNLGAKIPARNTDPISSHIAAHDLINSGQQAKQWVHVKAIVEAHPGHTSRELAVIAEENDRYIFSRRLPELESKGLIKRGDIRKCKIR